MTFFSCFIMNSIPGVEMASSGSWTCAPKEAFIVGLKELPESDDPVTHRHIFYAHAYKVSFEFRFYFIEFALPSTMKAV